MAGTFSQIYIQYIFAVKGRENLLQESWRGEVFKYISGIIREKRQKSIIVNGVSDHVHVFAGIKPSMNISDLVRDIKNNSTNFINDRGFLSSKFSWQGGFAAFSYSHSQIDSVYQYILNQEKHHKRQSFRDEYFDFLCKYGIDYDERFLFDFLL
jgi:REP element-mobilizing transposase RayT